MPESVLPEQFNIPILMKKMIIPVCVCTSVCVKILNSIESLHVI